MKIFSNNEGIVLYTTTGQQHLLALIQSQLTYGIVGWGVIYDNNKLNNREVLQK